ncbi:hypothetical protein CYMTET_3868 [Cymbomonas tetramitiformis]|uniref:Uncharacterized protein n=1 Tax=Cymbomonas tetramitiformis TaxID=36881 RepID=A0AAE0LKX9_9CHLO|nr:hypothetical protein CYMTET_3868 [Cymbomonas tetramitiformis]
MSHLTPHATEDFRSSSISKALHDKIVGEKLYDIVIEEPWRVYNNSDYDKSKAMQALIANHFPFFTCKLDLYRQHFLERRHESEKQAAAVHTSVMVGDRVFRAVEENCNAAAFSLNQRKLFYSFAKQPVVEQEPKKKTTFISSVANFFSWNADGTGQSADELGKGKEKPAPVERVGDELFTLKEFLLIEPTIDKVVQDVCERCRDSSTQLLIPDTVFQQKRGCCIDVAFFCEHLRTNATLVSCMEWMLAQANDVPFFKSFYTIFNDLLNEEDVETDETFDYVVYVRCQPSYDQFTDLTSRGFFPAHTYCCAFEEIVMFQRLHDFIRNDRQLKDLRKRSEERYHLLTDTLVKRYDALFLRFAKD